MKDRIKQYVDDGNALPWQEAYILKELFDGDDGQAPPSQEVTGYLSNYIINDTPADVGSVIFADANDGDSCGMRFNTVDIVVDNFNDPFSASSITYTFETDRLNISSYFRCFPGYMHFSNQQVKKIQATTVNHRAPVTTFRQIPVWRNHSSVVIPNTNEPPGMAISEINVNTAECAAKKTTRLTVGIDITRPFGGLYIQLESPDGYLYKLHKDSDNAKDGFISAGGLKTLFYFNVKNGSVFKDGIWKLIIYKGGGQIGSPNGILNEWQIEFTDDSSAIVTAEDAANCANATLH